MDNIISFCEIHIYDNEMELSTKKRVFCCQIVGPRPKLTLRPLQVEVCGQAYRLLLLFLQLVMKQVALAVVFASAPEVFTQTPQ